MGGKSFKTMSLETVASYQVCLLIHVHCRKALIRNFSPNFNRTYSLRQFKMTWMYIHCGKSFRYGILWNFVSKSVIGSHPLLLLYSIELYQSRTGKQRHSSNYLLDIICSYFILPHAIKKYADDDKCSKQSPLVHLSREGSCMQNSCRWQFYMCRYTTLWKMDGPCRQCL